MEASLNELITTVLNQVLSLSQQRCRQQDNRYSYLVCMENNMCTYHYGEILQVNYDKKTKKHQCLIESYGKQER